MGLKRIFWSGTPRTPGPLKGGRRLPTEAVLRPPARSRYSGSSGRLAYPRGDISPGRGGGRSPSGAEVGAPAGRKTEPQRGGPIAAGARRDSGGLRKPEPGTEPPTRRGRAEPYPARTGGSDNRSYVASRGTPRRSGAAGRNIRRGLSDPSGGSCGSVPSAGWSSPPESRPPRRRTGPAPHAQTGDEGRGGRACEATPQCTHDRVQPASGRGRAGEHK